MLSTSYMIAATVFSLLGVALFVYGKRAANLPLGIAGVLLIVLPCVLFNALPLSIACVATLAVCFGVDRLRISAAK